MPHTQTHLVILVDETASMTPYASQVVDGMKHYVQALTAQTPGPVFATLASFAEEVTVHYTQRPLHRVDKLRLEDYQPNGQTALYDAILKMLPTANQERQHQLFIIVSDGEDVCSTTSLTQCADTIVLAQQRGVLVVFLGDGPEAMDTAALLGIPEHCRYRFTAREGLHAVFQLLAMQTVRALTDVATRGLLPECFFAN
jgi:von Willebrand factor type A domain